MRNGFLSFCKKSALTATALAGLSGFAYGASEGFLSVPDETIGKIGFRVWEYRAVTNDDVRTQSVDFKDAAQYRPAGKEKTFDTKVEAGETFVRMGENGRKAFHAGVRPVCPFAIRPGTRYSLRFSARCSGGSGMVYLQFLDAKGKNVSDKVLTPKDWTYTPYNTAVYRSCPGVSSNWCEQVLSFLAPDGASQVLPVVAPWIDGAAKWFDCRSLVLEGAPFRVVREEVRLDACKAAADGSVELVGAEAGLKVKASLVRDGSVWRIAATVSDVAVPPRPRALEVAAEWTHDLVGWTWHRDWRRDETVAKGSSFRACNNVSGLSVGTYPFTAVSKDGVGVAIGTELDDPAFECGTVTDGGVSSVRALGLLKRGDFGTSADLAWLVLPFRGEWGFRSAAKAYYASQAHKIPSVKVGAKEGTRAYLGVSASEMPEDSSDYGLAYYIPTGNAKQRQIAREKGMFAHPYILAWQIPSAHYADYGLIPSMDERLAELQRWLSVTNERAHRNFGTCKRDLAQVLLNSMPLQADGSRPLSLEWYDGVAHYWRLNVDPRLPEPSACSTFRNAIAKWGMDTIDGVYLDNVYVQQFNNVRPDHLAVMKEPLVFDPETARPCAQAMQHQVAFVKMLADWLHPLDKRVTGNVFHGGAYRFNATIIDVFGCETGFVGKGKDRSDRLRKPCSDEASCEKRFYAYRRPVADLLQAGNWTTPVEAITAAGVTNYVEHHMFYGFYPSIVTIGGEDFPGYRGWKRYFGKSRQCVRDRELFKRAIPLIRRLNRAGWMPETLLRADDPKVMVERYGAPAEECLFTVRNETDKPVDAVLRPSAALAAVTGLTPLWRGGDEVPLADGAFRVRLAPWSTEVFLASTRPASAAVEIREGTIDLPSYAISDPEKSPVFDCKWSYQRARRSIYPYALNDNLYAQKSEMRTWKALYLENEWVKLCVLPEVGGRLFYAIDKTNGYDIFYRQDAIKPANVGMNGAWISGGVEWNVFHHHRISTQMPCDYRLVENADGSKTIWLGETERRHRMSWAIGITLRPGSSCMEIDGRLVNCTEDSNAMLFWANVATHANADYQIIFPQNTEFAAYHAKSSICHWPICREPFTNVDAYTNNVDVSWWKNHTVGNSLFAFELPEDFIGGYDHGRDMGTMLVGNRHIIRGGKFWSWGPNSGWPTKILTDRMGHYVELMVGAYTDSQPDYNWTAPGETKAFKQYWYGVRNLKGIKMGDETFALNMEKTAKDRLFLAVNATKRVAKVDVRVFRAGAGRPGYVSDAGLAGAGRPGYVSDAGLAGAGRPGYVSDASRVGVFSQVISVAPDRPWSATIDVPADVPETAYTMTVAQPSALNPQPSTLNPQPSTLNPQLSTLNPQLSYTPIKHDLAKPCPEPVRTPKRPKDIASAEECYYVGLRAEQFHQPYVDANDYFEEVLRRDPLDVRANTRLGIYYRRHWNLEKAEKHLRAALVRQTKDYTRVKDGEAIYNLGLVLADQGRTDEAIDCLYRAVWTYEYNSAANLKLARIYANRGEWDKALERVSEAIDYNAHNLDAKCLKVTLLRSRGVSPRSVWEALVDDILAFDPLNAYALYEKDGTMLSDDPEYALELALKFRANGFDAKCREILEAADRKVAYPGIKLHLGKVDEFLKMDLVAWRPFRRETKDALERLVNELGRRASCPSQAGELGQRASCPLQSGELGRRASCPSQAGQSPTDKMSVGPVWYALGNVYGNVDTAKAMAAWTKCGDAPYALRNLGYGHWKWTKDYAKALDFYRRAIAAKPDEAFFLEEFDHVAEEAKRPVSERYAMLKAHHATAAKRSGSLIAEIVNAIGCGDCDRALGFLRTDYFPTFEGAANLHDTYVDALLLKGAELEKSGDVKGAIALYEETENYPASQQVFLEFTKRRPRDTQVWYALGCAWRKLGDAAKANAYFEKAAAVDTLRTDYCYWKALCLKELGRVEEAKAIGAAMVAKGTGELDDYVDFFDYEGNRYGTTKDAKNAAAAYTRGLGHLLLGDVATAKADFTRCLDLKPDHLWAKVLKGE